MDSTADIRFTPRPDDQAPLRKRRSFFISIAALIILAVLLLVLAVPAITDVQKNSALAEADPRTEVDDTVSRLLQDVEAFAFENASELACASRGEEISELEDRLNENVVQFITDNQYDDYPRNIQGFKLSIEKKGRLRLTVEEGLAPRQTPNYQVDPRNIGTGVNRTMDCRTPLVQEYAPAPVFLKVGGSINALVVEKDTGKTTSHNHTFDRRLPYPLPYIETAQDLFAREGQGPESVMARMVNYMLTTVGRYRLSRTVQYGMDANESPRNVLNEGDVELAVNIALALWQMKVFGTYDQDSVEAVDRYFFNASQIAARAAEKTYDPTGERTWGEAEVQNYIERYYPARQATNFLGRTLSSLVSDYCFRGLLDPADIISLYLCMDQQPVPYSMNLDPLDQRSILFYEALFNPRYSDDYLDVANLELFLNLSPEREVRFKPLEANRSQDFEERFLVDQTPDYLIAGKQIEIKGIYPPKAWYTNAVMSLEEYIWKPYSGTRCSLYPPGMRPPDHDFRYLWDLDITLNFGLRVTEQRKVYHDAYTTTGCSVDRHVSMSLPVRVFLFWDTEKPRNDALIMENLNEGGMNTYPNGTSYWLTTSEADALEYFSKHLWQNLRPYNSLNMDEISVIEGALRATDTGDAGAVSELARLLADTLYWKGESSADLFRAYTPKGPTPFERTPYYQMYRFVNWYLNAWGIGTDNLPPVILDGYEVTSDWNDPGDTLAVIIKHQSAVFTLTLSNLRNNATRDITLRTQVNAGGLALDVLYHPFTSGLPDVRMAVLDGMDLSPAYGPADLPGAAGLDPTESVQPSYAVNLMGISPGTGQETMDSRLVLPANILKEQDLQALVDAHLKGTTGADLPLFFKEITALASEDPSSGPVYYPLGFENINNRYSFRLLLDTSGMSEAQAEACKQDLLEWAGGNGEHVFYLLGSKVGSLDTYRALLLQGLDQYTREHLTYIMTTPAEKDVSYYLPQEAGRVRFIIVPEGFYEQDLGDATALLWGIGTEGERFAAPGAQPDIQKGQFMSGSIELVAAVSASA